MIATSSRYIFTVSEVNQFIKDLLDNVPPLQEVLLRGEISNYKLYPSGHHYFTLKDSQCSLKCVMFRGSAAHLRFRPENGMQVIASGRISVYPRDGAYQLYCTSLTPEGAGDLSVAFEQLKEKLRKEGLFDESHKKPLPPYPRRIAIVTSPAGAAVHDMIRILRRRYPIAKVLLLPVRVQGTEAPAEIAGAIRYANAHGLADVLITGRGGGSLEDLWAFNDERVARAIYDSDIPVISAVGHEPDVAISDFVADRRASTPSNAAEIAVPDMAELLRTLDAAHSRMTQSIRRDIAAHSRRLESLSKKRVLTDPTAYLADRRQDVDHMTHRLCAAMRVVTDVQNRRFGALAASLTIHAPEEAKQGSAVKVRVVIDEQLPQLTFTWLGKNIAAPTVADGGHRIAEALLPVPVNAGKDLIVQATAGTLTGKATVKVHRESPQGEMARAADFGQENLREPTQGNHEAHRRRTQKIQRGHQPRDAGTLLARRIPAPRSRCGDQRLRRQADVQRRTPLLPSRRRSARCGRHADQGCGRRQGDHRSEHVFCGEYRLPRSWAGRRQLLCAHVPPRCETG